MNSCISYLAVIIGLLCSFPVHAQFKDAILKVGEHELQESSAYLVGEWKFFPNELLDRSSFAAVESRFKSAKELFKHPGYASFYDFGRSDIKYASSLIRIEGLSHYKKQSLGLFIDQFSSNFEIYLITPDSSLLVAKRGEVRVDGVKELSEQRVYPLSSTHEQVAYLLMYQHDSLERAFFGASSQLILGMRSSLEEKLSKEKTLSSFFLGFLVLMSIVQFILYLQRKENRAPLFLAIFSLGLSLRLVMTEALWQDYLPQVAKGFVFFHVSTVLLAIMMLSYGYLKYLEVIFRGSHRLVPTRYLSWSGLAIALMLVFFPDIFIKYYGIPILILHQFVSFIKILDVIVSSLRLNLVHSVANALSILLIAFGILADTLIVVLRLDITFFSNYTNMIFLLIHTGILSKSVAEAHRLAEQMAQKLLEKDKARSLFFNNISHELRTPINGILGFVHLVLTQKSISLDGKSKAHLKKSFRLAENLKAQVNTILDLAKAQNGRMEVKAVQFSLSDFKDEIDLLAESVVGADKYSTFVSELEAESEQIFSDREKLLVITRNLLSNAFKFKDPMRYNRMRLFIIQKQSELIIEVKDSGIGIARENFKVIFEEFKQVDNSDQRRYEGVGLGLTMVKAVVDLLGGQIEVSSEELLGSSFKVSIPVDICGKVCQLPVFEDTRLESADAEQAVEQEDELDIPSRQGYSILVVDDNMSNCEIICELLARDGYDIGYVQSARQALEKMRTSPPHLLLLDLMMPEMSGEEVLKQMKSDPLLKSIPTIVITARANQLDLLRCLNLGADDYLSKPIVFIELRLRVFHIIERTRLNVETQKAYQDLSNEEETRKLLVANLAHRTNNPLNYLSNNLELAKTSIKEQEEIVMALFEGIDETEAESVALKAKLAEGFNLLQSTIGHMEYGLDRTVKSVSEMRSLSGVDGVSVESLSLTSFSGLLKDKLEFAVGTRLAVATLDTVGHDSTRFRCNSQALFFVIESILMVVQHEQVRITLDLAISNENDWSLGLRVRGAKFRTQLSGKAREQIEYMLSRIQMHLYLSDDEYVSLRMRQKSIELGKVG